MRGFLGFLLLVVVLIGGFVFVAIPIAAPGLVSAVVRGTPPLSGQDVTVTAKVEPADLLRGRISQIRINGPTIRLDSTRVDGASITVDELAIFNRTFANLTGRASTLIVTTANGATVELNDLTLSGSSVRLTAIGQISAEEVIRLLTKSFSRAGLPEAAFRLEAGAIVLTIAGQDITGQLSVAGDSVVLTPGASLPALVVLPPGTVAPWQLTDLAITPTGITVHAELAGAHLG